MAKTGLCCDCWAPATDLEVASKPHHKGQPNEASRLVKGGAAADATSCGGFARRQLDRLVPTTQTAVFKILLGGSGWQAGALLAAEAGLAESDGMFCFFAGVGDGLGVFLGTILLACSNLAAEQLLTAQHPRAREAQRAAETIGQAPSSRLCDAPVCQFLSREAVTGTWLGLSALCSGAVWQATVNYFSEHLGLSFTAVCVCVGACGALVFFGALFLVRNLLAAANLGPSIAAPASHARHAYLDATLSVSIGGAAALFVATDTSFGDANWARGWFGVYDDTPAASAILRAGCSAMVGFFVFQCAQNLALPRPGWVWLDAPIADEE
eukprot:7383222-Prymnesium_polylepis.1